MRLIVDRKQTVSSSVGYNSSSHSPLTQSRPAWCRNVLDLLSIVSGVSGLAAEEFKSGRADREQSMWREKAAAPVSHGPGWRGGRARKSRPLSSGQV